MATNDGKRVAIAFRSVRQCHSDIAKLLRDLDTEMAKEGRRYVWGNAVTLEMSKSVHDAEHWMPDRIYRFYKNPAAPLEVNGINVWLIGDSQNVLEPLLVAGYLRYLVPEDKQVENVLSSWDLLSAYCDWCKGTPADLGKPLVCPSTADGRIQSGVVVGKDLYAIEKLSDVMDLLSQCRNHLTPVSP